MTAVEGTMLGIAIGENEAAAGQDISTRPGHDSAVPGRWRRQSTLAEVGRNYRVREADLHVFLRGELEARGWKVRDLAEKCGRNPAVVSRWLALEPHSRVVPDIKGVLDLAEALELDPLEVAVHAAYLPPQDGAPEDPDEVQIAQILRTFGRQLRAAPADKRAVVLQLAAAIVDAFVLASNRIIDQPL